MNRRMFLYLTGITVIATSGCLGDRNENGNGDNTNFVEVDSPFAGEECPSFEDSDETRCYHEGGTEPDVRLVPEQEVGDPTEEPMALTLHNDSDSSVWGCPLSECWDLHKLIDGEWRLLTPFREDPLVSEPLEADDSHVWNLEMSNEDVDQGDRLNPEDSEMAYTGSGTYAFSVSVSTESGGGGDDIELVALFEIEGESLELEPIGVEGHKREDGTVTVRMEREGGETETEAGAETEVVARKVDGTVEEGVEPMLTELAAQLHPVRNALAFFDEETEEIRFETNGSLLNELSLLRRAANIYEHLHDGSLIEVTQDGPVEEFPYRFRFLHEGTYYEIVVEEMKGSN